MSLGYYNYEPEKWFKESRNVYNDFQYAVWQRDYYNMKGNFEKYLSSIVIEKYIGNSPIIKIPENFYKFPQLQFFLYSLVEK